MNGNNRKQDSSSTHGKGIFTISEGHTVEGIKDELGGLYSYDGKKFIKWLGAKDTTSYKIMDGVEEICDDAFNVMTGIGMGYMGLRIKNIIIPEGVKDIGNNAFYGSTLTHVELPDSLETIGDFAFYGCSQAHGLDSIYIPENVRHIGKCCFINHLNISKIEVSPKNKWFCSEDNALYNKDKTQLIKVAEIMEGEQEDDDIDTFPSYAKGYVCRREFKIPDSVHVIKSGALECCFIKELVLHDNIRTIEENSMGRHEYLYIGANVNKLPDDFFNCTEEIEVSPQNQMYCCEDGVLYNKEMTKLLFCSRRKDKIVIPSTVGSIGSYAFARCGAKKLIVPPNISVLGDYAFRFSKISEITFSQNLCKVGCYVFEGCSELKRVNIPKGTEREFKHIRYTLASYGLDKFEGFHVDENLPEVD